MEPRALLESLLELSRETGLPVQRLPRRPAFEGLSESGSGVCRVRGELRVLLSDADPVAAQIRVLARALRAVDAGELEGRFLAPAVRACLESAPDAPSDP